MKKIDWNSLVPLGMDGKTIRNRMLTVLSISAVWSLQFIWKCGMEVNGLYYINWTERVLQPGAQMRWFSELVDGAFVLFGLTALSMLIIAVILYLYHFQESKSIYTMRRLPKRSELWRRCLAIPGGCAAACLILSTVLLLLYFWFYHWITPEPCLQPGQWQHLWEEWLCWN